MDTIPRVDVRSTTMEEFIERFERPGRPCILTGVTDGWPAAQRGGEREWTWEGLRERFSEHKFKVRGASAPLQLLRQL